jgi:hypothetical protein
LSEAVPGRLVAQNVLAKNLERHVALEARVFGAVDGSHAALAEAFDDVVSAEGPTDHRGPGGRPPLARGLHPRNSLLLRAAPGRGAIAFAHYRGSLPARRSAYVFFRAPPAAAFPSSDFGPALCPPRPVRRTFLARTMLILTMLTSFASRTDHHHSEKPRESRMCDATHERGRPPIPR